MPPSEAAIPIEDHPRRRCDAKAALRVEALGRRAGLDEPARSDASRAIVAALLALPWRSGLTFAAYLPIRDEVDLTAAIAALDSRGHAVVLPAVIGPGLAFRRYRPGDALVVGAFGTRFPAADAAELPPDVMLLPLAAFDRAGGRIGYGGGFYDRAVARLRADGVRPCLIGAAFSVQEVNSIPLEPHDVPLDLVATERGLVRSASWDTIRPCVCCS